MVKIALANLPYPESPDDAVARACAAVAEAGRVGAAIVCFPEAYVPGYRGAGKPPLPAPSAAALEAAWSVVAGAAGRARVAVVLGTERVVDGAVRLSALVIGADGARVGFQDKVQLDPTEDGPYVPGAGRRVFDAGGLRFGVTICHEGWRYPETVRFAAPRGAQVVFHPHLAEAEPDGFRPTEFADPRNTFHEKAILCRAAENTVWVATVNYASAGSPTTSAVAAPDGTLWGYQPYGKAGLFVAELDLGRATGLLAGRCRAPYEEAVTAPVLGPETRAKGREP